MEFCAILLAFLSFLIGNVSGIAIGIVIVVIVYYNYAGTHDFMDGTWVERE